MNRNVNGTGNVWDTVQPRVSHRMVPEAAGTTNPAATLLSHRGTLLNQIRLHPRGMHLTTTDNSPLRPGPDPTDLILRVTASNQHQATGLAAMPPATVSHNKVTDHNNLPATVDLQGLRRHAPTVNDRSDQTKTSVRTATSVYRLLSSFAFYNANIV